LTDRDLVSDSLGSWLSGDGALYTKLAIALRNALLRGDIPPGTALPPERTLAQTLSVSRTTVVGAYRLLREEGWLDSRQGSGHVIRHPGHDAPVPYVKSDIAEAIARNPLMRPASSPVSGMVDFSASRQASIGPLLHQVTQSCGSDLDALAGGPGYMPLGLPALRSAVARYSEELTGVPTRAEQILITAGSQQAIWLVGQLYAPYGERVVIENPTYAGSTAQAKPAAIAAYLADLPGPDRSCDAERPAAAPRRAHRRLSGNDNRGSDAARPAGR
jgi:DNA-binding transcriptional MocR family regulator